MTCGTAGYKISIFEKLQRHKRLRLDGEKNPIANIHRWVHGEKCWFETYKFLLCCRLNLKQEGKHPKNYCAHTKNYYAVSQYLLRARNLSMRFNYNYFHTL